MTSILLCPKKTRRALILCVLIFASIHDCSAQVAGRALKTVITLLVGAGAAASFSNAAEAKNVHESNVDVIKRLKVQGLDPRDGAIYSVYFTLNGNAESVYWADLIGRPDIFIVVSIEGRGPFLIPRVYDEYAGQPILESIFDKSITPGTRVVVSIFDDDSFSDAVWNNLMQTRVSFNATTDFQFSNTVAVSLGASGSIRLLDRSAMLDPPDYIAGLDFRVPKSEDGRWVGEGMLSDSSNRVVGKMQFAQVWKADMAAYEKALLEEQASMKRLVWWGGLGVVLVLVFGKLLISKEPKAA